MSLAVTLTVRRGQLTVDLDLAVADGEVLAVSLGTLLLLRDRWLRRTGVAA